MRDSKKPKNLIILPGKTSPEELIYNICLEIIKDEDLEIFDLFWTNMEENYCFTYDMMKREIIPKFESIKKDKEELHIKEKSTKGFTRERNKKLFQEYNIVFPRIFDYWLNKEEHIEEINKFYNDLKIAYFSVCEYHYLPNSLWPNN